MIKFLKRSRFLAYVLIFINISSLIASEIPHHLIIKPKSYFADKGDIFKQLYNEDGLLSFDAVIRLIEEVENGTIDDICTEEDWYKINHFMAFLANAGMLPNRSEEEKAELQDDIQELLKDDQNFISSRNIGDTINNFQIIPAIFYGNDIKIVQTDWFSHNFKKGVRFIDKNKKVIIAGVVVAVAAAATVTAVVLTAGAATAVAATALAASSNTSSNTNEVSSQSVQPANNSSCINNSPANSVAALTQQFEDQINDNKNKMTQMTQDEFLDLGYPDFSNEEFNRIFGSSLSHSAFENILKNIQLESNDQLSLLGHGKIDDVFGTNQFYLYFDTKNMFSSPETLKEHFFYFQGQQALKDNNFDIAINNFNIALQANPQNHNIYLDRAYAFLQDGQFDLSLSDYKIFSAQKNNEIKTNITLLNCVDFTVGMRKGIEKGVIESGKQLVALAGNIIQHPVNTYSDFVQAIQMISDLAKDNEWKNLSTILFPEISELVGSWNNFTALEKGEKSGYIIGKYGADIFIPGAATKAVAQGVKGAKELVSIAKNIANSEKVLVLEALAETGGRAEKFNEVIYANRITKNMTSTEQMLSKEICIFEKNLKHIFRDSPGHLKDTPFNRKLLINTASDAKNYLGTDIYGNRWYAMIQIDGTQVWTSLRNNQIRNGGINIIPQKFDPITGLSKNIQN